MVVAPLWVTLLWFLCINMLTCQVISFCRHLSYREWRPTSRSFVCMYFLTTFYYLSLLLLNGGSSLCLPIRRQYSIFLALARCQYSNLWVVKFWHERTVFGLTTWHDMMWHNNMTWQHDMTTWQQEVATYIVPIFFNVHQYVKTNLCEDRQWSSEPSSCLQDWVCSLISL